MAAATEQQWLGFDELSVELGQHLLLYPDPADKSQSFSCQLVGYMPQEALMVGSAPNAELPSVIDGQRVVIRINLQNGVALFPATVMLTLAKPRWHIYLDFPGSVRFRRVRDALRVNVTMPVLGANLDRTYLSGIPGKITDLSVTGAKVAMFQVLGQEGERVELKAKCGVNGVTRNLTVEGTIRTAHNHGDHVYGVQFFEGSEEQRLVLENFVFHAMAFGRIQVIQ